ncbi:MAG TPA: helix-turn-helix transcriptional regulator, partial [Anaeromyxobacteraceae bacterium]
TYSLVAPEEMALLNRRIEEAHRVLLDAGARAGYDAALPAGAGRAAPPVAPPFAETTAPAAGPAPGPTIAGVPAAPAGETAAPAARSPELSAPPAGGEAPAAPAPAAPEPGAVAPAPTAAPAPPAGAARPAGFSVPEGTPWTGELLRQAREGRGLTLHQVAERTKVTRHHLENLEADRYDQLPAPVYLRGILLSVAKELRLDPQKVARSYLELVQAARVQKAPR